MRHLKQTVPFSIIMLAVVVIMAVIYLLIGSNINPTYKVTTSEIVNFNKSLKSDFKELKKIKTYIIRPTLYLDIYIKDDANLEAIFEFTVDFIINNTFETIKPEFTDRVWADSISINFYKKTLFNKSLLRSYEGSYYSREIGHSNELDNFTHWRIFDGRNGSGKLIGTYVYEDL